MTFLSSPKISAELAFAIEDAVLLGGTKELKDIIDLIEGDADFPSNLRYGIEALYYFRLHYGMDGEGEPKAKSDKTKVLQMEAVWGKELIESLDYFSEPSASRSGHMIG